MTIPANVLRKPRQPHLSIASRAATAVCLAAVAGTPGCGPSSDGSAGGEEPVAQTSSPLLLGGPQLDWQQAWMPGWTNAAGIVVAGSTAPHPAIVLNSAPMSWTKTVDLEFWPTVINSESWPGWWSSTSAFFDAVGMTNNQVLFYDPSSGSAESDPYTSSGQPVLSPIGQYSWSSDPMLFAPLAPVSGWSQFSGFSYVSYDQTTGHAQLHDDYEASGALSTPCNGPTSACTADHVYADDLWSFGYTHFTSRGDRRSFLAYKRDTGFVKIIAAVPIDQNLNEWVFTTVWQDWWTTGWDIIERIPITSDDALTVKDGYLLYDQTSGLAKIVRETQDSYGNVTGVQLLWWGNLPTNMNIVRPYCARYAAYPYWFAFRFFAYDASTGTAQSYRYDNFFAADGQDHCGFPWSL
jgi:hypothetical protein